MVFYEDCERALSDNGVLVTNLFSGRQGLDSSVRLLQRAFPGRVLCLPDEHRGNLIVMAFVRAQGQPAWKTLGERATRLEALYGLEFPAFLEELKACNAHDADRLLI
jgi:spermidine synthase